MTIICVLSFLAFVIAIVVAVIFRKDKEPITPVAGLVAFIALGAFVFTSMEYVPENKVGVVIKKMGTPLPAGQIVARNGETGPQADILSPGWYFWYWPWAYEIEETEIVEVPSGNVGVVTTTDGKPLQGQIFAPEWTNVEDMLNATRFFQNGFKGPQLTVLTPGKYRLNPRLFTVNPAPAVIVNVGEVAVVKANAGPAAVEGSIMVNGVPLVKKGSQGIWDAALLPGMYYMHPEAYQVVKVSTTNRVYDYAESDDKKISDPILVRSKDGFTFPVDIRCTLNISAENAPYLVGLLANPDAKVSEGEDKGLICNLEAKTILPCIRTILRNTAEKLTAFEFVDLRSQVEKDCSTAFATKMKDFKINSDGCFIGQIDFDHNPQIKSLMQTRTDREVALNQQKMYQEQERSQQERAKFVKASEEAEQQKLLVAAQYEVQISQQKAKAKEAEAQGQAKYVEITFAARKDAYEKMASSIGKDGVTLLEMLNIVKEGKIQITPQVMVNGNSNAGMIEALAGTIMGSMVKTSKLTTEEITDVKVHPSGK
jgi:regulator of protease activity HflC (stomatin/prohibitin superfamily)